MDVSKIKLCIEHIFPDIIKDVNYYLYDKGNINDIFIGNWNYPQPQPTQSELKSAYLQVLEKGKWQEIRKKRNDLLLKHEWMVIRHVTQKALGITPKLTAEQYTRLLTYSQELRDIPQKYSNPDDVVFPVEPT